MECANDVRTSLSFPEHAVAADGRSAVCAWALTLIKLDMAPDIIRVYRALSINRLGDFGQPAYKLLQRLRHAFPLVFFRVGSTPINKALQSWGEQDVIGWFLM